MRVNEATEAALNQSTDLGEAEAAWSDKGKRKQLEATKGKRGQQLEEKQQTKAAERPDASSGRTDGDEIWFELGWSDDGTI